ncbi:hypothetical protein KC19_VG201800 [Ceratodon purpureus]|uniref:Uncharacterized protein n=1 Tax=Ceratodon purpureus TaxID=3225 RepID=A0A8T0HT58_CERPU|nr:hypothetical protein KC19_VG201800 [Ceratodon purpureus]
MQAQVEPGLQTTGIADDNSSSIPSVDSPPVNRASESAMTTPSVNPESVFLPKLCDDIVRYCIWPKIFPERVCFSENVQQIARMRSVCTGCNIKHTASSRCTAVHTALLRNHVCKPGPCDQSSGAAVFRPPQPTGVELRTRITKVVGIDTIRMTKSC